MSFISKKLAQNDNINYSENQPFQFHHGFFSNSDADITDQQNKLHCFAQS